MTRLEILYTLSRVVNELFPIRCDIMTLHDYALCATLDNGAKVAMYLGNPATREQLEQKINEFRKRVKNNVENV